MAFLFDRMRSLAATGSPKAAELFEERTTSTKRSPRTPRT
jgi:hypothetical protein